MAETQIPTQDYVSDLVHPVGSAIFLINGKTPNRVGLKGTWVNTSWSICTDKRLVFDVAAGKTGNSGTNVDIFTYNGSNAQLFWFYTKNYGDVNMWVRTA